LVTLLGFKVDDSGREKYNKGIDQTKQKQQSLTASFLKAQVLYGAARQAVGAAFSFIKDSVFSATVQTEKYRASLGVLIGDQEKANTLVKEVSNLNVGNIYGDEAVLSGVQGLMQFGIAGEEAMDTITRLGDIANGSGVALSSLGLNMGQVFAKGKADATDLKQFVLQGFDVVGMVASETGKTREEVEKAGVTYEQTASALKKLTSEGGKYYGMMDKVANTLGGVVGQLGALRDAIAMNIGLGISDNLKELLKYILEIGRAGQESFVNVFVKALNEVIHWIWQIIIMWEVLGYRIADMGDAFAPVKQFFLDLKDAAGDVLIGIMILAVELGTLIVAAFKPIQAFASPIIRELGAIAKDVFTAIADFIRPLIPMVSDSAGFFGVLGQAIAGLLRPAMKAALAIKGITLAFGAFKTVKGTIETVSGTFSALKETIGAVKIASQGVGHGVSGDVLDLLLQIGYTIPKTI
jgi:tape measure domain-containing protein